MIGFFDILVFSFILISIYGWRHVCLNSYFTGADEARKRINNVTVYKSYEKVLQIFAQYFFQGG